MISYWAHPDISYEAHSWMGVSENSVPLNPMVLLIIIPFLNGYFIGNINPTFSDKTIWYCSLSKLSRKPARCSRHQLFSLMSSKRLNMIIYFGDQIVHKYLYIYIYIYIYIYCIHIYDIHIYVYFDSPSILSILGVLKSRMFQHVFFYPSGQVLRLL